MFTSRALCLEFMPLEEFSVNIHGIFPIFLCQKFSFISFPAFIISSILSTKIINNESSYYFQKKKICIAYCLDHVLNSKSPAQYEDFSFQNYTVKLKYTKIIKLHKNSDIMLYLQKEDLV